MIGSANSSNTRALERLARESGRRRRCSGSTVPTSSPTTSPAPSASPPARRHPRSWSSAVIAHLAPADGVEEVRITDEDEYFPRPASCATSLTAVDVLATFSLGGSVPDRPGLRDRDLAASDVLAQLSPDPQPVTRMASRPHCSG